MFPGLYPDLVPKMGISKLPEPKASNSDTPFPQVKEWPRETKHLFTHGENIQ